MIFKLQGSSVLLAEVFIVASQVVMAANTQAVTQIYAGSEGNVIGYSLAFDGIITQNSVIQLPALLQFAVAEKGNRHLYVASSNIDDAKPGDFHRLSAFTIDHASGHLEPLDDPEKFEQWPVYLTLDRDGTHSCWPTIWRQLSPFMRWGQMVVSVYRSSRINRLSRGFSPVRSRSYPNNRFVISPGRGNDASSSNPENLGTLSTYAYVHGKFPPVGGDTFASKVGPCHVVYHPCAPLAYMAKERGSSIYTYRLTQEGRLANEPVFKTSILNPHWQAEDDEGINKDGVILVRPDGKYLYGTNRSDKLHTIGKPAVFKHGKTT